MSDGTAVIAKTFLRVLEVPPDDIDKGIDLDDDAWLKCIQIIHSNESWLHVPLVALEHLVIRLNVR